MNGKRKYTVKNGLQKYTYIQMYNKNDCKLMGVCLLHMHTLSYDQLHAT